MFRLAQEKGLAPWELVLLFGVSILLTAFCLCRIWRRSTGGWDRIFWSFSLVPLIGPLFVLVFCESPNDAIDTTSPEFLHPGLPVDFTPRAQAALGLARKEADRLNHNFVGTEHVLLGLVKLGQGPPGLQVKNGPGNPGWQELGEVVSLHIIFREIAYTNTNSGPMSNSLSQAAGTIAAGSSKGETQ